MKNLIHYFRKLYTSHVLIPVSNIRKQGITSEALALSISIGIIGGAFPLIGFASYICLFLTLVFKQNIIIVQVANWLSYPIQILLLIPFMKLGNAIFGSSDLTITIHQVVVAFQSGLMHGVKLIGIFSLYGVIAWAVIALPSFLIVYSILLLLFRNIKRIKLRTNLFGVRKIKSQDIPPLVPSFIVERTSGEKIDF
jgi:uncharacterized protein (DUF2062 family)